MHGHKAQEASNSTTDEKLIGFAQLLPWVHWWGTKSNTPFGYAPEAQTNQKGLLFGMERLKLVVVVPA